MSDFWKKFQIFLDECIPSVIVNILIANGYDDSLSLIGMCMEEVAIIEKFTNEKLGHLWNNSPQYSQVVSFSFLPGHKKLILALGKKAEEYQTYNKTLMKKTEKKADTLADIFNLSDCSILMQELVNSLKSNSNLVPTSRRYSENIKWFSIYAYMLGGKHMYELLCKNFPLPQLPTVGT